MLCYVIVKQDDSTNLFNITNNGNTQLFKFVLSFYCIQTTTYFFIIRTSQKKCLLFIPTLSMFVSTALNRNLKSKLFLLKTIFDVNQKLFRYFIKKYMYFYFYYTNLI